MTIHAGMHMNERKMKKVVHNENMANRNQNAMNDKREEEIASSWVPTLVRTLGDKKRNSEKEGKEGSGKSYRRDNWTFPRKQRAMRQHSLDC